MREDALHAGARVVADEGDAVHVPVLHALDHGQRLVPSGEHLGAVVEVLQSRLRMVQCASLISTSSAPPSKKPSTAAFTSEVNIARHRSH